MKILVSLNSFKNWFIFTFFEKRRLEKKFGKDFTAKELGLPIGEIQCPHCNAKAIGAITPICSMCDKNIFEVYGEFTYKGNIKK